MSAMPNHPNVLALPPMRFTIPEAAWVAEIDAGAVRNDIKKRVVVTCDGGTVFLDRCDVSYFRAVREVHDSLGVQLRRRIRLEIRDAIRNGFDTPTLSFGFFDLRLGSVIKEIGQRISDVCETRDLVENKKERRGGVPVIKGTRISPYTLAEIYRNGASLADLSEAYSLSERQVRLAILFDELRPRRGRPSVQQPDDLSNLGACSRTDIEELGEFRQT